MPTTKVVQNLGAISLTQNLGTAPSTTTSNTNAQPSSTTSPLSSATTKPAILTSSSSLSPTGSVTNSTRTTNSVTTALPTSSSPSRSADTSSTTTSSANPTLSSGRASAPLAHDPLSTGAIAGVAIACAVAGATFALILMWFLRRSRSQRSLKNSQTNSRRVPRPLPHEKNNERTFDDPTVIAMKRQPKVDLDAFLPQQADDATVNKKLLHLFDQIESHVDNFYAEDNQNLTHEQQIEVAQYATPGLPMPLVALLQTSRRKTTILKHCLGYHAMLLVSPSNTSDCLLPYEISSMLAYSEAHRDATRRDPDRAIALSRWRMLTAYLRPDIFGGDVSSTSEFESHIHDLATKFCDTFNPFSQLQHEEQKVKHLVEVLRTALRFALWLYSHPATFDFRWGSASDGSSGSGHTVVTVPSLIKTYDGRGSKIEPPQVVQALVKRRV
ncbi:hypothetical protein EDD37DRAFT_651435 [Exophiala viscosa]|uniref:Uncharacterized protein n=1 Tax=Exophiala viscosa TaxID=2486360 RepID=A0AAN6DTG0_9EURO|nr:hypothetical protein EDD36DRAFT_269074 [Exophiala viscosa]KAI1623259.1 hypothetical protein EDD37DRAFT_651435 [Exophiala viscosa]